MMIDAEGSELLAEVFNKMTLEQKNSAAPEIANRLGTFMVKNGYRVVFGRWYLQEAPSKEIATPDIRNAQYEFDDPDREVMDKVRRATQFARDGDPIKDAIDDDEIADALALLVRIVDGEA